MKFNLFQLHDDREDKSPRSWLRLKGEKLLEEVRSILSEIINKHGSLPNISKIVAERLDANPLTVENNLRCIRNNKWYTSRKNDVSIPLIDALLKIWDIKRYEKKKWELIELTEFLIAYKSKPTKAVKELILELCKIAGAHAADGTLSHTRFSKSGFAHRWIIIERDEKAIKSLKEWIENVFGVNVNIKKSNYEDAFKIVIDNKVIFRYLTKILGFKTGHKIYTVSMPSVIQKSNLNMRRNFALGVLTFDGCVDIHGYVRMGLMNEKLRDSVVEVMKEDGIDVKFSRYKRGEFVMRVFIKENDPRILNYFDGNSIKYILAKFFIDGSNAENIMELFNGNVNSKINLRDVLEISRKLRVYTISTLRKCLELSHRTMRAYLRILEKAGYLEVIRPKDIVTIPLVLDNIDDKTAVMLENNYRDEFFNRVLIGSSQKDLARVIGVFPSVVNNWKCGRNKIQIKYLKRLLNINNKMDEKEILDSIKSLNKNIYIYKVADR